MTIAPWIQTFTGRRFWLDNPRPEDVDIIDIAHALSNENRFAGHTIRAYSVAEHSVRVAALLPVELKLWGLLHDAAEAYVKDIPKPLKAMLPEYRAIEERIQRAVCVRFGLQWLMPAEVEEADAIMLRVEALSLFESPPIDGWTDGLPVHPYGEEYRIDPMDIWTPTSAAYTFSVACDEAGA